MRNKKLQGQVTAGRWTLPIVVFICTLCWVLTSFLLPDLTASTVEDSTLSLWQSARDLLLPAWAERLVSYLIYAVIGYSLIELNNRFGIIRMRASMQTAIYFLLVTICPEMHLLYAGDIAALAFLFSIYFLFKSYQQPQAAGYLFYSFLFIGAGSLLFPQLTFLSVLWIFEAHRFQALKPRSFCGALLGWVVPYWFLFGHAFFYNQMELFYRPFTELVTFGKPFDLQILQPWELAVLGYLLVLFIVSAAHCIIAGFEDKIRTRAYLQFLIDLNIFLFLLIALQPTYCVNLLPLLMISSSILIGHFFVLTNSKTSNVFFIISLVSNIQVTHLLPLTTFFLFSLIPQQRALCCGMREKRKKVVRGSRCVTCILLTSEIMKNTFDVLLLVSTKKCPIRMLLLIMSNGNRLTQ